MDRREDQQLQYLLSLPPRMAEEFGRLENRPRPTWIAGNDPSGHKLGSGGGTAHLLEYAWRQTRGHASFADWLNSSRKLIIHGGGESRRLPAYATVGKSLMPVPVLRWSRGQRLDQSLLDLQLPTLRRIFSHAPAASGVLIASGDVVLEFGRDLPAFPQVDVLGFGMWVTPEKAKDFGVYFMPRAHPSELAFFLQKPTPARIRELAADHVHLVDSGMWLLSENAVNVLMVRSGWDSARQAFRDGVARKYELYSEFGLALGTAPVADDPIVRALSCGVVPLPQSEFYHFGASRQMIESTSALQNRELDETKLGLVGAKRHPDQYLQNARFHFPLRLQENHTLWVENATIPATWRLASDEVITGVPDNDWDLILEPGVCLDFVPIGDSSFCVRVYGIDDDFRGPLDDVATQWLGPAPNWFYARGISREKAGILAGLDIYEAPLFPVLDSIDFDPRFLEWLFQARPLANEAFAKKWLQARRLSSADIPREVNLDRLYRQREAHRKACLRPMLENSRYSVFLRLDLEPTAFLYATTNEELPASLPPSGDGLEPMREVHEQMFHAAVLRFRRNDSWEQNEANAFARLREMIVADAQLAPVTPRCALLEDQIVWGRSPVRLDLAGGWTDTPPYCLEHGGRVVNLAVDLNGQPPIQVFAKLSSRPELVMRSIDLGTEERVTTFEELDTFARPNSDFAVAKAAFALAGFLPRFHASAGFRTLREQLEDFGGGIEISLLAAVPKGSGLGTSSILAATVLGTLGNLCGLEWDRAVLFSRTLALEQMLTTGGGWQDQAGGIFRGIKMVETGPGLDQRPTLRWLPDHLFDDERANREIMVYYTGLTRLAKNILQEIVRGIFLNSPERLAIVQEIAANAERTFHAIQMLNYDALAASIRNSWRLNQSLDSGTNPPQVQSILDRVQDYLAATKLLGAGGGGYLLMLAKDETAARRVRETLSANPPNNRARFVDFSLSKTGLALTRS